MFLIILFSYFELKVRIRVMRLHCYTSVISDNMVTVMVTGHEVTEKDVESSGKIISYSM